MPETTEAPERVWVCKFGVTTALKEDIAKSCDLEYIRLDLHDASVEQAVARTWEKAIDTVKTKLLVDSPLAIEALEAAWKAEQEKGND